MLAVDLLHEKFGNFIRWLTKLNPDAPWNDTLMDLENNKDRLPFILYRYLSPYVALITDDSINVNMMIQQVPFLAKIADDYPGIDEERARLYARCFLDISNSIVRDI